MHCKNCQSALPKNSQFCMHCGQNTRSLNKPLQTTLREAAHELLDIDGRLWLTLRTLLGQPGKLTHDFNLGKRVKYTPPLRLYLAISIIFFVIFSKIYQVYDPSTQLTESMLSYYSKAMFVLFPVFAAIVQLFFRNSYYVGNLVFSLHLHSVVYLLLMIIAPLEALESKHILFLLLQLPPVVYLAWYIFTAFKTVFQQSWWQVTIKASAIYLIYMAVLGLVFDVLMKSAF